MQSTDLLPKYNSKKQVPGTKGEISDIEEDSEFTKVILGRIKNEYTY